MLSFSTNGNFTYRPNAGFIGSDSFTISISDGTNQVSATITVNIIEVAPTNLAHTVTSANLELVQYQLVGVLFFLYLYIFSLVTNILLHFFNKVSSSR